MIVTARLDTKDIVPAGRPFEFLEWLETFESAWPRPLIRGPVCHTIVPGIPAYRHTAHATSTWPGTQAGTSCKANCVRLY